MKKKLFLSLPVVAIVIQFLPAPAKSNPPVDPARTFKAVMKPPAEVDAIVQRACMDCHSNETKWPWYADVAPVSWPVRHHVEDGRRHLNFSEWLKPGEANFSDWNTLEDICATVRDKTMPLPRYDWMHPEAKLTDADRQAVCGWVDRAFSGAK
jgi:hypothetical protein